MSYQGSKFPKPQRFRKLFLVPTRQRGNAVGTRQRPFPATLARCSRHWPRGNENKPVQKLWLWRILLSWRMQPQMTVVTVGLS